MWIGVVARAFTRVAWSWDRLRLAPDGGGLAVDVQHPSATLPEFRASPYLTVFHRSQKANSWQLPQ